MRVLSFDTETSIGETIHGPTFRDKNNDIYTQIWATHPAKVKVVHNPKGFKRTLHEDFVKELKEADILIGHNIGFDLCYVWDQIKEFILRGGIIWDTQEAEYILTAQQHTTASLAELQLKYQGEKEKPSRISGLYKKGVGADKIVQASLRCRRVFKLYNTYCISDGSSPLKIFKAQYIRAKQEGMLELIKMRNMYLLAQLNMSCTGIYVDLKKCEKLFREYSLKHLEYLKKAVEILSSVWVDPRLPEFNVNSPKHKSAVLFGGKIKAKEKVSKLIGYYKNGNPRYKKEDDFVIIKGLGVSTLLTRQGEVEGVYSTDGKVLKSIYADKSTPEKVKEYCRLQDLSMKYNKAANTYCKAFIERSVDGKLYPHFNNTITPTGRLSSSEPNMQNIPMKSFFADDLMGLLVAPPGYLCVSADYNQLEKWLQAWVSNDKNLKQKLLQGVCLHCLVLANIEQIDYEYVYQKAKIEQDPIWDEKRTNIKPIGFRMDYGGMPRGTAIDLGLDQEFVESVHEADKALFPDKYKFFEQTLPKQVMASSTFSRAINIPASKKKGKDGAQISGNIELLPIFDKYGKVCYTKEMRRIGYWRTEYGKKYHFMDTGKFTKDGIKRRFSMPQFKNYPNQGGGSDVQGSTSAELVIPLLKAPEKLMLLNEIHDSKLFYVREDLLHNVLLYLKETMENIPKIFKRLFNIDAPFKFPVEFKVGKNFSPKEMTKYEFK